jgi:hypothetical protein
MKILIAIGSIVGSWLGWWLGMHVGIWMAFILSLLGAGGGLYVTRRLLQDMI